MLLKSLKLSGFKSFARPTVLDFPHKVVAIVGPNGSGKSNITEAISWVLGEQSIKNLRGKKGEDLIFSGSVSMPTMSKASATLCFSDSQKENECVLVSRVVYKDGTNEYLINDSRCRRKDVVELLSTMKLGSLHHHIIGQGESDKILEASPRERMEIITDSLGLGIYQIRKDEGERKLKKTKENIEQVKVLRQEISPHLKFLERQVKKAEKEEALKDKLKELCNSYFSFIFGNYGKEIDNIKLKKEELKNEFARAEEKKKDTGEMILEFRKKSTQKNLILSKINNLEREIGRYEGIISQQELVLDKNSEENQDLSPKEVGFFLASLDLQIKKALLQNDTKKIKKILNDIKEELDKLINAETGKKKKEKNTQTDDSYCLRANKIKHEHKKLSALLKEARGENDMLNKNNEGYINTEREFLGLETKVREIVNNIDVLKFKEKDLEYNHGIYQKELKEAETVLGEKISLDVGRDEKEDYEQVRKTIERVKIRLEESGNIGREIIKEYEEIKTRDDFLENELNDLENTVNLLQDLTEKLGVKLDADFKNGLSKINTEFHKFFNAMFEGGKAELKLEVSGKKKVKQNTGVLIDEDNTYMNNDDEENVVEKKGIEINVSLPRRKVSSLSMFSGGEKALTSTALLFAMSQINPPPFLILDETDAALDESNSRRYAKMLLGLSKKMQLILITHNRETMNVARILYGVTMGRDGVSQLLSVKFDEAQKFID